jgi:choline dehydrogenase-like flavoprotein
MLAYAQNYPPDTKYSADICIVGAGAAGITLAHKLLLMQPRKKVLLLESANFDDFGPMTDAHARILREYGTYPPEVMAEAGIVAGHRGYDKVAQALYRGVESDEMRGIDPDFLTRSRLRAYGGTTNCWGGWTRPLSRIDFQRIDLGQTWPISSEVLYPVYFNEAMKYCSLPPVGVDRYDQEAFWLDEVRNIEFMDLKKAGGKLVSAAFLVISGQRLDFQTVWGPALEAADANACTVLRNANIRLVSGTAGNKSVDYLFGSTIEDGRRGRNFTVQADEYVLATGGVEVPRLLLSSAASGGFATGNPNLGRYFQIHPLNTSYGSYAAGPTRPSSNIVNLYAGQPTVPIGPYPPGLFASLVPSDSTLSKLELRNFRARVGFPSGGRGVINMNWEQAPNPASRVLLSAEKDPFWGDPLTQLDWQTLTVDARTAETGFALVGEALEALGYGKDFRHQGRVITAPGDHAMGSARMSATAKDGYVDRNCQVFGADNLFIASSAVFTTSGYANPTLTIIALAARLADYLVGRTP